MNSEEDILYLMMHGSHGAGKTVAWCCAYQKMIEGAGSYEFMTRTDEWDDFFYQTMGSEMCAGRLPKKGPVQPDRYGFQLAQEEEDVCEVVWMDCADTDIIWSHDSSLADVKIYNEMLRETELAVCLIPSEIIGSYIRLTDHKIPDKIEREIVRVEVAREASLIKVYMDRMKELRDDDPPVLFYLTKADLIEESDKRKLEALKQFIKEFHFFDFESEKNQEVLGCFSSLGKKLRTGENREIISGFSPTGFEIPLLLAIGHYQVRKVNRKINKANVGIFGGTMIDYGSMFLRGLFGMGENERTKKRSEEIQQLKEEREILVKKKQKIQKGIIGYIEGYGDEAVFYLNKKGEECPMKEFFE